MKHILEESDEMEVTDGPIKVVLENIGEGVCGDYDPEDPDDVNLLRFSVYMQKGGEWVAAEDASCCTQIPADADYEVKRKALDYILREVVSACSGDITVSIKRLCERLSWIGEDSFPRKKTCVAGCGMEIREEDGFVCPYFSRPEEWKAKHKGLGPCFVDLQHKTNVCLYAPEEFIFPCGKP